MKKIMKDVNLKIGKLKEQDFEKLYKYLNKLSATTSSKFAAHDFSLVNIQQFYLPENKNTGFTIENIAANEIVAYAIIKKGHIPKDKLRLENYGVLLYPETDCTFAPSVADDWQSKGLGNLLFTYIKEELQNEDTKRMILWGGVQALNEKAINFYLKHGFKKSGEFENKGVYNFDMLLDL
ncbi:GNAT family N-acetyltransferase [Emticicia sp. BO119]|uniref:GNAT family N-acetyltransferase n=1 Tax=Emticicia sp. BO119 TaxID=2757768 RepID=UPI0015F0DA77|nr:GNAT family N-acetyltransferase [Emticicia sp. BO119]MBA4854051.1 GNAT family N-acetyltransferase [Emticicia sp. BO119]